MEEDGTRFKVSYPFMPYFYVLTQRELLQEVIEFLSKKYAGTIINAEVIAKEDLDLVSQIYYYYNYNTLSIGLFFSLII